MEDPGAWINLFESRVLPRKKRFSNPAGDYLPGYLKLEEKVRIGEWEVEGARVNSVGVENCGARP